MNQDKKQNKIRWNYKKSGDLQSFETIYRQFYPDLYAYALKLTGQEIIAKDAIHDTFAYIWQHRNQLGEISSIKFYLLRSLRNQCLKLLQQEQRYANLDQVEQKLQMTILPDELLLTDDSIKVKKRINDALNTLSPRQREIIFLKYFNNLDYEEIAELLSINYQSVVNHIHKAIVKLRGIKELRHFK